MSYTPTVRGRRLAHELRRLREEAGLTGEQAAERVHWDQSKISRIENARMRATAGDVLELLEVYRVSPTAGTISYGWHVRRAAAGGGGRTAIT